ncbi:CaiB/BaiF CoA-transferase family protein [Motiliproteus sp. MSK22-1]|uniref:CaiB/BaiF CoA transferase family protein n=1 Tax=Motiliproteus sp. MSK22-1 TaxID=1897630 RepID=UPI000976A3FD|nr:CaiB/BaiF CoA-transferase family protein [Motiliproteus sp. MSK22-1]OMH35329.1 carnitine dehydratase [Motiliproteus sp. MSK22-1]
MSSPLSSSTRTPAPLEGLKVLDFSTLLPGPYATQMLADMGAEVLRVESPSRADIVREMKPQLDGQSAAFHYLNRGKKSLALDLKNEASKVIVEQLIKSYDVLVEQFRPGVMDRLGLGYAQVKAVNPGIIYCSITGYGQDGPMAQSAGHDINYLSRSGISSYLGRSDAGPVPLPIQVADISGGSMNAVTAILAALFERQHSDQGQHIDISMTDSCFAMNALFGPGALQQERSPAPQDNFLTGAGIYDYYRTSDQRYLSVGSLEPQFRQRLCQAVGQPDWSALSDEDLKTRLTKLFLTKSLHHWQSVFESSDACVEPVLTLNEAAESDLMQQRQMVTRVGGNSGHDQIACPVRFSGVRPQPRTLAPASGQHTQEVLRDLGYSDTDLIQLEQQGVFK